MSREKIHAALAAVVENIKTMGAERFRAEIDARENGDLAKAFAEIEAFASEYVHSGIIISSALVDAIHWGLDLNQSFDLSSFEQWVAANDSSFVLAA